jgi:hypothetical protein
MAEILGNPWYWLTLYALGVGILLTGALSRK